MKVTTTHAGVLEVPDHKVLFLPHGLLGFPDEHHFVLLIDPNLKQTQYGLLQSVKTPEVKFVVTPWYACTDLKLDLNPPQRAELDVGEDEKIRALVICNIHAGRLTGNLRAPIILGRTVANQIEIPNNPIRAPLAGLCVPFDPSNN